MSISMSIYRCGLFKDYNPPHIHRVVDLETEILDNCVG